jgi:hypothetical protein
MSERADWRLRTPHRFGRLDWIGDAAVTLACAAAVLVCLFLPWANTGGSGSVDYSAARSAGLNGVMATQFGWPVLALGSIVAIVGVLMLVTGPRRSLTVACGLTSACGLVLIGVALAADRTIYPPMHAGLGLYTAMMVGLVLIPVGAASAMVCEILIARARHVVQGGVLPDEGPPR